MYDEEEREGEGGRVGGSGGDGARGEGARCVCRAAEECELAGAYRFVVGAAGDVTIAGDGLAEWVLPSAKSHSAARYSGRGSSGMDSGLEE